MSWGLDSGGDEWCGVAGGRVQGTAKWATYRIFKMEMHVTNLELFSQMKGHSLSDCDSFKFIIHNLFHILSSGLAL